MDDVFTQNADSYYFDNDMRILLDTMRVVVRSYLVGKIAPKMMAMSANFLAEPGPVNANMASESTAAGVVWDAIGLGKSVSRGTLFAKNLYLQRQWTFPECVYCGNSITNQQIQMDHAMPIKHGGYSCHHAGNLFPSCRSCNQPGKNGKGAKYLGLDGWIRIKDFLGNNPKLSYGDEAKHDINWFSASPNCMEGLVGRSDSFLLQSFGRTDCLESGVTELPTISRGYCCNPTNSRKHQTKVKHRSWTEKSTHSQSRHRHLRSCPEQEIIHLVGVLIIECNPRPFSVLFDPPVELRHVSNIAPRNFIIRFQN